MMKILEPCDVVFCYECLNCGGTVREAVFIPTQNSLHETAKMRHIAVHDCNEHSSGIAELYGMVLKSEADKITAPTKAGA